MFRLPVAGSGEHLLQVFTQWLSGASEARLGVLCVLCVLCVVGLFSAIGGPR
jgi:hypothetical protein